MYAKYGVNLAGESPVYIHHRNIIYDSGIHLNDLEHISCISLDTFHETVQTISTKLSSDDSGKIIQLESEYTEFAEYYKEVAMFRENTDNLTGTFSEALKIMDHNATLYMIDEMQKEIDEKTQELDAKTQELDEKIRKLIGKNSSLCEKTRNWRIKRSFLQNMLLFCERMELSLVQTHICSES